MPRAGGLFQPYPVHAGRQFSWFRLVLSGRASRRPTRSPLAKNQEIALAGYRDIKMPLRYAHLTPSHLRAGIQALEQRTAHYPAGLALSTERRVTPVSREFSDIA